MDSAAKQKKVFHVFEEIAENYDAANERISLGFQRSWKRMLLRRVMRHTAAADRTGFLDVCCGTGDITVALAEQNPEAAVTGIDFSPAMLEVAKRKGRKLDNITWLCADAEKLPFEDNVFQAATISFGLRNTTDYRKVLTEMIRVVRPGGWIYVLESCIVDNPVIRPFYMAYFCGLMPFIGGGRKHFREYRWLWQSTEKFLRQKDLLTLFRKTGLRSVTSRSRMFGACVLVEGQKAVTGSDGSV